MTRALLAGGFLVCCQPRGRGPGLNLEMGGAFHNQASCPTPGAAQLATSRDTRVRDRAIRRQKQHWLEKDQRVLFRSNGLEIGEGIVTEAKLKKVGEFLSSLGCAAQAPQGSDDLPNLTGVQRRKMWKYIPICRPKRTGRFKLMFLGASVRDTLLSKSFASSHRTNR